MSKLLIGSAAINEALWHHRHDPASEFLSSAVREHACLGQSAAKITLSLYFLFSGKRLKEMTIPTQKC